MLRSQFSLLWQRRFLPLFATQFFGAISDSLFKNALVMFLVYSTIFHVERPAVLSLLAQSMLIIPFFLFSALGGQLADKYNKTQLILLIKACEVAFMVIGVYGFLTVNIPLLFFTLFLAGCQAAFFGPVKFSILPEQLRTRELIGGNALIEASTFLAILLGVIVGTEATVLGVNLISLLLVALSIAGFCSAYYIEGKPPANPGLKLNFNLFRESINIVRETRKIDSVFKSILGISWFWLIGATFLAQIPSFTRDTLSAGPSVVQLFLCAFSIGIGVGSLICNRLLEGQINAKYVPLGVLGMTFFIFDVAYSSGHVINVHHGQHLMNMLDYLSVAQNWRVLVDITLLSICGGIYVVPLYALMQHDSPATFRSRAIACNNIINAIFMCTAAAFTITLLFLGFSINQVFFVVGLMNMAVSIYICQLLPEALVKSFVNWILRLLYKVKVNGMENYHEAGEKVLIIANHTSYLDVVLLSAFLPQRFTYVINTDVAKKWWMKPFLALVEALPIDPTNPMTTKSIIKALRRGKKCIVFPEGRITTTGTVMKVYEGPGLAAQKSGAKLLPIRIEGAEFTVFSRMRGKFRIRLFPRITLHILKPREFNTSGEVSARMNRRRLATELYKLMTEITFESCNTNETVFRAVLNARQDHGGRLKVIEDINRRPLSYNQLLSRTTILGRSVSKFTRMHEHVGIMLPTSSAGMISFFACQAFGRIPAMINFSTGLQNILSACRCASITTIITSSYFLENAKLTELAEQLEAAGINLVTLEALSQRLNIAHKCLGWLESRFASLRYRRIEKQTKATDAGVILFTSGSEGTPKGVLLSHQNILANCYQISSRVDFTSSDIMLIALPIFHCFGLTAGAILPLLSGIRTFYYPSPLHYRIVPEFIYDQNATIVFGTDTFLSGYSRYAHPYDFYSVRYIFAGAEKLKPETRQTFMEKFGVRLFEGYGATETAPVLSVNTPMLNKVNTVGCFMPGVEHRLTPVEGINSGGRLWVRGPNVMMGYLSQEKPGAIDSPVDGWYDTGDIVSIDSDGFLTIEGRAKRFAKIGGEMVSLTAVELAMKQVWPDHNHAIISISDAKKGEALVLVTDHPKPSKEHIISTFKQLGLTELYVPKRILSIDPMPVLVTGKIDYQRINEHVNQDLDAE
jgi:acyl-[acyl-carrier-protein]-phospholipid O-acyltransferase / long-chain-fatty-acid--[acyl-carrier-protein] ligase